MTTRAVAGWLSWFGMCSCRWEHISAHPWSGAGASLARWRAISALADCIWSNSKLLFSVASCVSPADARPPRGGAVRELPRTREESGQRTLYTTTGPARQLSAQAGQVG